jgi:PAS domain S-box-containing protein
LKQAQRVGKIGDWDYDLDSGKITWSEELFSIYERDPELGAPDYDELFSYYPEESSEVHENAVKRALEKGEDYRFEVLMLAGKKTPKFIEAHGITKKDKDGNVFHLYGTVQDITARKQAELKLEVREERLSNVINSVEGAVMRYVLSPDGTDSIDYVSEGAKKIWGFTAEEVSDDISLVWNNVLPDDLKSIQESIQHSAKTLEVWDDVYQYQIKNGNIKWIHGRGTPKKEDNGNVRWDTVLTDITNLKKAELENEVLLQEVHHRVKNNLAIISGLLQLEEFETDNEELILPLKRSQNRILSMAKVHEMLYKDTDFSSINIKNYLIEISETIKRTMNSNNEVEIKINTDDYFFNVNTAIPFGMLMNELLSNSFKYAFTDSEEGRINIDINTKDKDTYEVYYEDNGRGFKKGTDLKNPNTLGMTLIKTLLSQLESEFTIETENKFKLSFSFRVKEKGSHSRI